MLAQRKSKLLCHREHRVQKLIRHPRAGGNPTITKASELFIYLICPVFSSVNSVPSVATVIFSLRLCVSAREMS